MSFHLFICLVLLVSHISLVVTSTHNLCIVINAQPSITHHKLAHLLDDDIQYQATTLDDDQLNLNGVFITTDVTSFENVWGAHAVWPIAKRIDALCSKKTSSYWMLYLNDQTTVLLPNLVKLLDEYSNPADELVYMGHSLVDEQHAVIHHYEKPLRVKNDEEFEEKRYLDGSEDGILRYADDAGGILLSSNVLQKLNKYLALLSSRKIDFAIDLKYEFAKLLLTATDVRLQHRDEFCTQGGDVSCVTNYHPEWWPTVSHHVSLTSADCVFAVKTCEKFHADRVPIVQSTWAPNAAPNFEFYSESEDTSIPTIVLPGVENTERGHCGKTFAIFKRFIEQPHWSHINWLIIADDDTLLSVDRLLSLLSQYVSSSAVIIGEKYGYGYTTDGIGGYDYPTGGSGMVFTRTAVQLMLKECSCPMADSPDDMIIGMCARQTGIPIVHSRAFHQARPREYAREYLSSTKAISFHKYDDIDPLDVYEKYLAPEKWRRTAIEHDEF